MNRRIDIEFIEDGLGFEVQMVNVRAFEVSREV
jgi:hypothetical protein